MTGLTLHDYFRSSASYRVRIALNLKRVPHDRLPTGLPDGAQRTPAYLALNPQGLVPALVVAGGADALVLTQSYAIIDWLDRTYPEPGLIPDAPAPRARALAMTMLIACDVHPLNNLRVLHYLRDQLGIDETASAAWYRHWVVEGLDALEIMARETTASGRGPHLGGDAPGIADVFLVPQMANARRFGVPVDGWPTLVACETAALALDAFAAAAPDRVAPPA